MRRGRRIWKPPWEKGKWFNPCWTDLQPLCVAWQQASWHPHTHAIAKVIGQIGDGWHPRLGLDGWRRPVRYLNTTCIVRWMWDDCLWDYLQKTPNHCILNEQHKGYRIWIHPSTLSDFGDGSLAEGDGSLPVLMTHWWACLCEPFASSLENNSWGIPELWLHHVVIIAAWPALMLNKLIQLYLGMGVISKYLLDGSQDFLFGRVRTEVKAFHTIVSDVLKTLRADSWDIYANPVPYKLHLYITILLFCHKCWDGNVFAWTVVVGNLSQRMMCSCDVRVLWM